MIRSKKAKTITPYVGVQKRDPKGRPTHLITPGEDGKQYQVIIRRFKFQKLSVSCKKIINLSIKTICPDMNYNLSICKHCRAAINYCIAEAKMSVSWCSSYESAIKLSNMGGKIYFVDSLQNKSKMWLVVKEK